MNDSAAFKATTDADLYVAYERVRRQIMGEVLGFIGPSKENFEMTTKLFNMLPTLQDMAGETPNAELLQKQVAELLTNSQNESWIRYYLAFPLKRQNTAYVMNIFNHIEYDMDEPKSTETFFSKEPEVLSSPLLLHFEDIVGEHTPPDFNVRTRTALYHACLWHFVAYFTLIVSPNLLKRIDSDKVPAKREDLDDDEYLESYSLTAFGFGLAKPFLLVEEPNQFPDLLKPTDKRIKLTSDNIFFGNSGITWPGGTQLSFWSVLPDNALIAFLQAAMLGKVLNSGWFMSYYELVKLREGDRSNLKDYNSKYYAEKYARLSRDEKMITDLTTKFRQLKMKNTKKML